MLQKEIKELYRYLTLICCVIGIFTIIMLYFIIDPSLSSFKEEKTDYTTIKKVVEDDYIIENGIHVATGFVEGEGLKKVIQNCTNCHSSKLVIQNRMSKERWTETIKWMQETQNLWDLGENEAIIINYLATHYAPKEKGRRENIKNIEWYELEN